MGDVIKEAKQKNQNTKPMIKLIELSEKMIRGIQ